jgi:hypothetical protein
MKLASKEGNRWREEQAFRWFRLRKRFRQFLKYRPGEPKDVLFIVGCQRSGTSMIHHLFRLDWDAVTYDEWSPLSVLEGREPLRWRPLDQVKARIMADRAPFVVCKPLVETQVLPEILAAFPGAKAIWMYRDFRDVASSSLQYFGEQVGHGDLGPILEEDDDDWRSWNLGAEARDTVRRLHGSDLGAADAAALFWYARNSLYFSLGLDADPRVALCRYGELVTEPARIMRDAYRHVGRPYPGDRIVADVFGGSKGKGRGVALTEPVAELCGAMLERLDARPRLGKNPA